MKLVRKGVITCTSQHIYNWRKSDGGLLWVSALDYTQPSSPSSSSSNDDDIFQVIMMKSNVLVIHHNSLSLYNLETGNREWYSRRDHGQILGVTKDNNQKLISISLMNHILGFTKLDMERGKSHHEVHSLPLHVRHGGHHDSHSSSTHPFIYSFSDNFFAYVDQNAILILDIHLFLNVHHIPLSVRSFFYFFSIYSMYIHTHLLSTYTYQYIHINIYIAIYIHAYIHCSNKERSRDILTTTITITTTTTTMIIMMMMKMNIGDWM